MTTRAKAVAVFGIQLLLVLSIGAKFLWERHTCPRVWARATQYDPDLPLRGRYLSLQVNANACGFPDVVTSTGKQTMSPQRDLEDRSQTWEVQPIVRDGQLSGRILDEKYTAEATKLSYSTSEPCDRATLQAPLDFFVSEKFVSPFPLPRGQELWAEVTVPSKGPPRPIQLAVSDGKTFTVLPHQ